MKHFCFLEVKTLCGILSRVVEQPSESLGPLRSVFVLNVLHTLAKLALIPPWMTN